MQPHEPEKQYEPQRTNLYILKRLNLRFNKKTSCHAENGKRHANYFLIRLVIVDTTAAPALYIVSQ